LATTLLSIVTEQEVTLWITAFINKILKLKIRKSKAILRLTL
jgi:hypothetical protein